METSKTLTNRINFLWSTLRTPVFIQQSKNTTKTEATNKISFCVEVMRPLVTGTTLTISLHLLPPIHCLPPLHPSQPPDLCSGPLILKLDPPKRPLFQPHQPSFAEGLERGQGGQSVPTTGDPGKEETLTITHLLALCEHCEHPSVEQHYAFTCCRCVDPPPQHPLKQTLIYMSGAK